MKKQKNVSDHLIKKIDELIAFFEKDFPHQIEKRLGQLKNLQEELKDVEQIMHLPIDTEERQNAYWWFPMVVDLDKLTCDIKTIVKAVGAEGIPVYGIQWPEGYQEGAYRNHGGFGKNKFPFESKEYTTPASVDYENVFCENAAWHRDRTFNVFTHPVYTQKYREYTARAIKKVLGACAKQKT